MSDYHRFVSYIYLYENGMRSMNAGFVRVESRNGECRLGLSLKNVCAGVEHCDVYLFMRHGAELHGIYIGTVKVKNHGSEWNFKTRSDHMAGSEYRLDQMAGMIIFGDEKKFYGTRWDQGSLDIRQFRTQWETESVHKEAEIIQEPEEKALVVVSETDVPYKQEEEVSEPEYDEPMIESEREKQIAKVMGECPEMYPFEDDAVEGCVRLEPQDLCMLPLDCWAYGSNGFLLRGYYSYRHLILAKTGRLYILGVPGTKHTRDAFMAGLFGFKMFKPIRGDEENGSDFGYWCTRLN